MRVARRLLAGGLIVAGLVFASSAQAAAPSCLQAPQYAAMTSFKSALFIATFYGSPGHSHTLGIWDYGTCYLEPGNGRSYVHWYWPETDNQTGLVRYIEFGAYVYGSLGAYNMGAVDWQRWGLTGFVLQSGSYPTPSY